MKDEIIEILVEEPSMKNALEIILPQISPPTFELGINCFIRPHQGKTDLQKSIPRKVRAYQYFLQVVKLIVVHDQDSNDCLHLQQQLVNLVHQGNDEQPLLVRIACRELENWYLGDMQAIEAVYPTFKAVRHQNKAKYRNSDNVFAAKDLERLIKDFAKGFASKHIPTFMKIEENNSTSFKQFVSGVKKFSA